MLPVISTLEAEAQPLPRALSRETDVVLPELSLSELLPESELFHPDVMAQVEIDLGPVRALVEELTLAYVDRDNAEMRRLAGNRERSTLLARRWEHRVVVRGLRVAEQRALVASDEAFHDLGAYAVSTFVGNVELDLEKFDVDGISSPIPELTDSTEIVLEQRLDWARSDLGSKRMRVGEAVQTAAEIDEAVDLAERRIEVAELNRVEAEERILDLAPRFEEALVAQTVADTDIPIVVLDAYFRAQLSAADRRPGCQITWDQLAGVGLIETGHGSFGGSRVRPDGTTTKWILGPVLDGTEFGAIPDTDGGKLDGDVEWDRAVGPMQFIPGSWKAYGMDGDGDGVIDPHNIYDAALAASEHLCRSQNGLSSDGAFRLALLGYNNSEPYGLSVMAARGRYRRAVRLEPSPSVIDGEEGIALQAGVDAGE